MGTPTDFGIDFGSEGVQGQAGGKDGCSQDVRREPGHPCSSPGDPVVGEKTDERLQAGAVAQGAQDFRTNKTQRKQRAEDRGVETRETQTPLMAIPGQPVRTVIRNAEDGLTLLGASMGEGG